MGRSHIVTVVKELYKCLIPIVLLMNYAMFVSTFLSAALISPLYAYLPHVYNKTYVLIITQDRQYDKTLIVLSNGVANRKNAYGAGSRCPSIPTSIEVRGQNSQSPPMSAAIALLWA